MILQLPSDSELGDRTSCLSSDGPYVFVQLKLEAIRCNFQVIQLLAVWPEKDNKQPDSDILFQL